MGNSAERQQSEDFRVNKMNPVVYRGEVYGLDYRPCEQPGCLGYAEYFQEPTGYVCGYHVKYGKSFATMTRLNVMDTTCERCYRAAEWVCVISALSISLYACDEHKDSVFRVRNE